MSASTARADINVTPLVDVVLVLLIIFMVVAPLLGQGVHVALPATAHHDRRRDDNRDVIIAVTVRGEIFVGDRSVAEDQLSEAVAAERRRRPSGVIYLKGDGRVSFAHVRRVLEILRLAGIDDLELATEEVSSARVAP